MTITLAPRIDAGQNAEAFSPRTVEIYVTKETAYQFEGKPTRNPNCPVMTYPKFAWVEVDNDY